MYEVEEDYKKTLKTTQVIANYTANNKPPKDLRFKSISLHLEINSVFVKIIQQCPIFFQASDGLGNNLLSGFKNFMTMRPYETMESTKY